MKKVALLMGGELRNFNECIPSWNNQKYEFDLFLSTWSTSNLFSERASINVPGTDNIQTLNANFEVTKHSVTTIFGRPLTYLNIEPMIRFEHPGNNQIFHWHRLLTALINMASNYDYAIITRPDCIAFGEFGTFIEEANPNYLYGYTPIMVTSPPNPFTVSIVDWAFMSSPIKLIDTMLPVPYMKIKLHEISIGKGDNMHTHLAHYFVSNNEYVYPLPPELSVHVNSFDKMLVRTGVCKLV